MLIPRKALKEVLREYQDEPCVRDGIKCRDCKFNITVDLADGHGDLVRLCDVLEELSIVLEVV